MASSSAISLVSLSSSSFSASAVSLASTQASFISGSLSLSYLDSGDALHLPFNCERERTITTPHSTHTLHHTPLCSTRRTPTPSSHPRARVLSLPVWEDTLQCPAPDTQTASGLDMPEGGDSLWWGGGTCWAPLVCSVGVLEDAGLWSTLQDMGWCRRG